MISNILQYYKIDYQYRNIIKLFFNIIIFNFWKINESVFIKVHDLPTPNPQCKRLHLIPFFQHLPKQPKTPFLAVYLHQHILTHFLVHKTENVYIGSTSTFHNVTHSLHNHPQPYSPKGLGHLLTNSLCTSFHNGLSINIVILSLINHSRTQSHQRFTLTITILQHTYNLRLCEQLHNLSRTLLTNSQARRLCAIIHKRFTRYAFFIFNGRYNFMKALPSLPRQRFQVTKTVCIV